MLKNLMTGDYYAILVIYIIAFTIWRLNRFMEIMIEEVGKRNKTWNIRKGHCRGWSILW